MNTAKAVCGLPAQQSIVVDYEDEEYEYHDLFKGYAPFFFVDVNFDGKKDLILNYRRQGQRHLNLYRAYLRNDYRYNTDLLYRQTEELPYVKFDDATEFNREKKEIVLHYSGGAFNWRVSYYRKNNKDNYSRSEFELYKEVERHEDIIYEYRHSKQLISESTIPEEE